MRFPSGKVKFRRWQSPDSRHLQHSLVAGTHLDRVFALTRRARTPQSTDLESETAVVSFEIAARPRNVHLPLDSIPWASISHRA